MTKTSGIYLLECKGNSKVYVGQSTNIHQRKNSHLCSLRNNNHSNNYLQACFNKYGEERLVFTVLELCDIDSLDDRERFWISEYQSNDNTFGFNLDSGGNAKKEVTQETRDKISKANKGRSAWNKGIPMSDEQKAILSESCKGRIPWNKGRKCTEEERLKNSMATKGVKKCFRTDEHRKNLSLSKQIPITEEMIMDIKNGIRRKDFLSKYGHSKTFWERVRKTILEEV